MSYKIGLSDKEVLRNKQKYGSNVIKEPESDSFFKKILESFQDPQIKLLLSISAILFVIAILGFSGFADLIGILIAICVFAIASARTEISCDKEYKKVKNSVKKPTCKVYRNNALTEISIDEIVVGDSILLQSGDKIYADGYIVEGSIKVENSALNGESESCTKEPVRFFEYSYDDKINGDSIVSTNLLFRESVVTDGEGIMIVTNVGEKTMIGETIKEMDCEEVDGPLKVKLQNLADKISYFGYVGAAVISVALMISNIVNAGGINNYLQTGYVYILKDILETLLLAVTIIVMAVPEGLPLMKTVVLKRNTSSMLKENVLIRKSIAGETAGSINILFSDKTGTITKGELEVVDFYNGACQKQDCLQPSIEKMLTLSISKNTTAKFNSEGSIIGGNVTDKALMKFITKELCDKYNNEDVVKQQIFNSTNKYSASQLNDYFTVYKGAPEKIIDSAVSYIAEDGTIEQINKQLINNKIVELANKSMRVIAFGYSLQPLTENQLPDDLILLGFVGIRDDVRPEAVEAIKEVQNAGVQVVMITGDRKETAMAIAIDSGIMTSVNDLCYTSSELNNMTDDEIKEKMHRIKVIARALPTDKSRMVRLSQEMNLVCGMTGDGVNDASALKRADIGYAMGSGTDVAKQASDVIIVDDNFKSIASSILYGRTIYKNIQKFIKFQLTINVSAIAISVICPFFGIQHPLAITHILWINLIMDGLASLALGSEPAEKEYMKEKPKSRTENIVNKSMMQQILFIGGYFTILSIIFLFSKNIRSIFREETLLTGYFSLFVLNAVFNGFNIRTEHLSIFKDLNKNPNFIKVMGSIVAIQILITFIGGSLLSCVPMNLTEWITVFLLSILVIPIDIIRKIAFK